MKYRNFQSFSTIEKVLCKKNGHFKLISNFSIPFENIGKHKVNQFFKQQSGGDRKQNEQTTALFAVFN